MANIRARNIIASAAAATSICLYATYRRQDQRVISQDEISNTLTSLLMVTPTTTSNIHESLSDQHIHNLTKYGATVVKDTLSQSELDTWRAITKAQFDSGENIEFNQGRAYYSVSKRLGSISKKSKYYSDMARIGCSSSCDIDDSSSEDTSNNTSWFGGLWKRRKRNSSSIIDDDTTTTQHTIISLQDVVRAYFKENGIAHYELTDVQFLNAYPHSTNQIWHRDNKFKGLTAIIALKDIRQNGPTELIVGSHATSFSLWNAIKQRESLLSTTLLLGCVDYGDTLLYDARIFHRGRGNNMQEEDRPVLVLRWDNAKTPPPGMGMIVTMTNTYIGCWYYAVLSALQQISPIATMVDSNGGSTSDAKEFYEDEKQLMKLCDFLRSSEGPPVREAIEMDKRVYYIKGEKLVNFMVEPKKGTKWPKELPRFKSRPDAIAVCKDLCGHQFMHRSEKVGKGELEISRVRDFDESAYFTWIYEGNKKMSHLMTTALVIGFLCCTCFPIWPNFLKVFVWYMSVSLLIFIFFLITFRALVFLFVWIIGYECWVLPNLFDESLGFCESFVPVVSMEATKEGQLPYRIGVFVAFFSFCYWAVTQPSEFDGFVKGQGDFIKDLYAGTLLSDMSQKDKENIDKPKMPSLEDLLKKLDSEDEEEEKELSEEEAAEALLNSLVEDEEDIEDDEE